VELDELERAPADGAAFDELPAPAADPRAYGRWKKDFAESLYRGRKLELFESAAGTVSRPGESERDFRVRLQHEDREDRDAQLDALRERYGAQRSRIEERARKAEQRLEKESEQARQAKLDTVVQIGSTLLGAVLGRSVRRSGGTAMRGVTRSWRDSQDVDRAREDIEVLRAELAELDGEAERELAALRGRLDPLREELGRIEIRPRRADVDARLVGLAWVPRAG
jgi:hypothetical protein